MGDFFELVFGRGVVGVLVCGTISVYVCDLSCAIAWTYRGDT